MDETHPTMHEDRAELQQPGTPAFVNALVYVYADLRTLYGQDRRRTFWKFTAAVIAYLVCFALSLGGTMILNALVT